MIEVPISQLQAFDPNERDVCWFALKIFYNRVAPFKEAFAAAGYETFVPMKLTEVFEKAGRSTKMVQAIPSLMFVRCSSRFLRLLKRDYNDYFMFYSAPGSNLPEPIREKEMEMFMLVCKVPDGELMFFDGDKILANVGAKVRVTGGVYKGAEGYIKRIKRDRRLLVSISGVAVVATSYIHPSLLEVIED